MKVPRWLTTLLISVVAALFVAAVVFPIFAQAKMTSGPSCLGKLRGFGIASAMYAADHDDRFEIADRWMDLLGVNTNNPRAFHDPKDVPPDQYGYAFRQRASGASLAELANPKEFVLVFDSTLTGWNAHSELWSIPRPGRHGQGTMDSVLFADGHAKSLTTKAEDSSAKPSLVIALEADDRSGPVGADPRSRQPVVH